MKKQLSSTLITETGQTEGANFDAKLPTANPLTERTDRGFTVQHVGFEADKHAADALSMKAQAESGLGSIAMLIFGFSISCLWGAALDHDNTARGIIVALLSISVGCCAYAIVVQTAFHHVATNISADVLLKRRSVDAITQWVEGTRPWRSLARYAVWSSLVFFMVATMVHVAMLLPRDQASATVVVLTVSVLVVLVAACYLRGKWFLKSE